MTQGPSIDRQTWIQRGVAFVTRSHRQLWGRNNESMLAWLFEHGLSNAFAKQTVLGWNKHDQMRKPAHWGISYTASPGGQDAASLYLPAGIVVPTIVHQTLAAITIYRHEHPHGSRMYAVPGSEPLSMVLKGDPGTVAVVPDIIDGLFLAQECGRDLTVIIPACLEQPLDRPALDALAHCRKKVLLVRNTVAPETVATMISPSMDSPMPQVLYDSHESMAALVPG